jgi:hypothetical protein
MYYEKNSFVAWVVHHNNIDDSFAPAHRGWNLGLPWVIVRGVAVATKAQHAGAAVEVHWPSRHTSSGARGHLHPFCEGDGRGEKKRRMRLQKKEIERRK